MQQHDRSREQGRRNGTGYVEDYTTAFLISAGVLLFVVLYAVLGLFGWLATLGAAYATNRVIPRRYGRQATAEDRSALGKS